MSIANFIKKPTTPSDSPDRFEESAKPNSGAVKIAAMQRSDGAYRISLHNFVASCMLFDVLGMVGSSYGAICLINQYRDSALAAENEQIWATSFGVIFYLIAAQLLSVYSTKTIIDLSHAPQRILLSLFCAFAMLIIIATATKATNDYSRLWFFSWVLASLSLVLGARYIFLKRLRLALAKGAFVQKAVSVGIFCDPIHASEIAFHSGHEVRVVSSARLQNVGELAALPDQIAQAEIDQVFIATPWEDIPLVLQNLNLLRHLSTKVFVLPGNRRVCNEVVGVSLFGDRLSFCAIEESVYGWSLWFKRAEDLIIAASALLALSPVMALIALAIRIDSPGPIFFRQVRIGFNGRSFRLWKFRSMFVEMSDHHAQQQTRRGDPRVTRVGRFIRSTSLDELPQLLNVLEGSMSIVGPRPHALATQAEGRNIDELVDYYAVRHRVMPGITGWAQVHGLRGELDNVEKLRRRVDYDLEYIDKWTIWLDLEIILRTIKLLIFDKHAY
jgi:Undecaprenyl-phosphate glucose phosphotransferase